MKKELPKLNELIRSKSTKDDSIVKNICFFAIGIYFISMGVNGFLESALTSKSASFVLIGLALFAVIKFRKIVYISTDGIVTDTYTVVSAQREMLKWEDAEKATLIQKNDGDITTIVAKKDDLLCWKGKFASSDMEKLKNILSEYLGEDNVEEMHY